MPTMFRKIQERRVERMENSETKQTPNQTAIAKTDNQTKEQQDNKILSPKADALSVLSYPPTSAQQLMPTQTANFNLMY
jgi:uncharacterized protein YcnI